MSVNPHAWLSTVPLTILLVAVYFQPADNPLKRAWSELRRLESDIWLRLAGNDEFGASVTKPLQAAAYWALVAFLAVGSLLSLATFAGLGA